MNMTSQSAELAALVGIDWASQRHALCLHDCATGKRENSTLEHTPEAIAQWVRELQERFKGRKIALCLEQSQLSLDHPAISPISLPSLRLGAATQHYCTKLGSGIGAAAMRL